MTSDQTSRGHNFEGLSADGNARQHNGDINAQVYNSKWMPRAMVGQCCYKHQITDFFLARSCILPEAEIIFPEPFTGRTRHMAARGSCRWPISPAGITDPRRRIFGSPRQRWENGIAQGCFGELPRLCRAPARLWSEHQYY
jgi:hypothetical protein